MGGLWDYLDQNISNYYTNMQGGHDLAGEQMAKAGADPSVIAKYKNLMKHMGSGFGQMIGAYTPPMDPNAPGAELGTANADDDRSRLAPLLEQLQNQAQTGNGAWQQQLAQSTMQNNNAATALGKSQPGVSRLASGMGAANAVGANNQRAVGQGNILRAQSQQQGATGLADLLGSQGGMESQLAQQQAGARQGVREANVAINQQNDKSIGNLIGAGGQAVATAASLASKGGKVPGQPAVFGDDEKNDTVPAWLSPGEIVLPRTVASSPELSAQFVRELQLRHGQKMADGGPVDPTATNQDSIFFSNNQAPASTENGALLDTKNYDANRSAAIGNAANFQRAASGVGPSVAPQQFQNTTDSMLANAMQSGANSRGMGAGAGAGAAMMAGAIGNQQNAGEAGVVAANEQQRGQSALMHALLGQRQQDQQMAQAQQQAAWRNSMMNSGIGVDQQAALRGILGAGGQALTGLAGSFGKGAPGAPDVNSYGAGASKLSMEDAYAHGGRIAGYAEGGAIFDDPSSPAVNHGSHLKIPDHGDPSFFAPGTGVPVQVPEPSPTSFVDQLMAAVVPRSLSAQAEQTPMTDREYEINYGGGATRGMAAWDADKMARLKAILAARNVAPKKMAKGGYAAPAKGGYVPPTLADLLAQSDVAQTNIGTPANMDVGAPAQINVPPPELGNIAFGTVERPNMAPKEGAGMDPNNFTKQSPGPGYVDDRFRENIRQGSLSTPKPPPAKVEPGPSSSMPPKEPPPPVPGAGATALPNAPWDKSGATFERSAQERKAAETDLGKNQAAMAEDAAKIESAAALARTAEAVKAKQFEDDAHEQGINALKKVSEAQTALNSIDTTVDPGRYWATRSTPGKIAGIIGLILGAVGNDNGINRAAQMMNQAIDRDLDAQKAEHEIALRKGTANLDAANSYYAHMRNILGDDRAAMAAAHAAGLERVKQELQASAAKYGSPLAKANSQMAIGMIDQQLGTDQGKVAERAQEMYKINMAKAAAGAGGGGAPTNEQKNKAGDADAAGRDIMGLIGNLRKGLESTYSDIPGKTAINQNFGTDSGRIDVNTAVLTTKLKDLEGLGQIGPGDAKLLGEQIGDLSSITTRESVKAAKLQELQDRIVDTVINRANASKIPPPAWATAAKLAEQ